MGVFRCFTEKREGFNIEARGVLADLRGFLGLSDLENVRIFNRYDVEGISREIYREAKNTVFSEPQLDLCYDEVMPETGGSWLLALESLPGQYDQRADSCAQCIQMLTHGERPTVKTAKVYVFFGSLTENDKQMLCAYLINPVESRMAQMEKPETLQDKYPKSEPVPVLNGFITAGEDGLREYLESFGLAMDLDDLKFLQKYFRNEEKRDPTVTELRLVDTYWSDHCRHTTFNTHIENVTIDDKNTAEAYETYLSARDEVYGEKASGRPKTLMDIATIGAKTLQKRGLLKNLDVSEEINACSIHVDAEIDGTAQDWLLMFKNETHNHPTEIEPFGGAATCIGGAIRDPLSGRAFVYQAMRVTGAANPLTPVQDTIKGKLPQRKLTTTAARGYSSYGNQIGLATGLVHEYYHPGYAAKRMEIGAVVGAVKAENVVRETPAPGDVVILLGGRTGRDGIGGATGSSKTHTAASLTTMASEVQKGNAPEERKIQRLFLDPAVTKMIKRCNDFGAGGVSVAIGELADGLSIDLTEIRKKYEGLDGTELAISESQERMAVVVAQENAQAFIKKAAGENLEAYVVAEITQTPRLVMRHEGRVVADLSRQFLSTNGAVKRADVLVSDSKPGMCADANNENSKNIKPGQRLRQLACDLRFCSQRGLYEMFDGTVGASSVFMKNGGKTQSTPVQAMASLLPVMTGETSTCSVMAFGFDPYLSSQNPYLGASYAVITSVSKLVASGCDPNRVFLTFQEYFERLRGEPERWGKPFSALLGALKAQLELEIAAIGGKDSMSGSFNDMDVPPTLVSFAIAPNEAHNTISPEFKEPNREIVLFTAGDTLAQTKKMWQTVRGYILDGTIVSAWAVTEGGAIEGIFKMALGNEIGFECAEDLSNTQLLFVPGTINPGAIIAEVTHTIPGAVTVGRTIEEPEIRFSDEIITLSELRAVWEDTLERVFPTRTAEKGHVTKISCEDRSIITAREKFASPHAVIFAFPGTNSEIDTERAVIRAGGSSEIIVIKNLTAAMLEESISEAVRAIQRSQMIIIPGGFSGGDEPDGSAKFITAFFQNPAITDAVHEHLKKRDGLMLGICNGFQALIKLGLVPFGEIRKPDENAPTLTYNLIGRHQAGYAYTRVASVKSPWLSFCNVDDVHAVAISHGEGRFIAPEDVLAKLAENGQIATQYSDIHGNVSMSTQVNPNGSVMAVEGILSPDGRVFGKMGHTERYGKFVAKNIYGNKHQPIFESGVKYFK